LGAPLSMRFVRNRCSARQCDKLQALALPKRQPRPSMAAFLRNNRHDQTVVPVAFAQRQCFCSDNHGNRPPDLCTWTHRPCPGSGRHCHRRLLTRRALQSYLPTPQRKSPAP